MRLYTTETLQYVSECPAKAYFSTKEKPEYITETQFYLKAVHQAVREALTTPQANIRGCWLRALKSTKLMDKVHLTSRPFLISDGIRVLWALTARTNKYGPAKLLSPKLELAKGTIVMPELFMIEADGRNLALLFDTDPNANIRKPVLSDPVRKTLSCLEMDYCVVSMFTGVMGRVKQGKRTKSSIKALNAMLAHAEIIVDKRMYYPRAGRHCIQCNWRKSCHRQFKEE